MGILSANNLRDSLQKAKGVGLVEEPFTICDCVVVVRSLRPDEYKDILNDCKDLEDVEYLNAFQMGHVSRAIVELNGTDLRDVQFIEDVGPDPKRPGATRDIKLELHKWLEQNVLRSWGREAIFVSYRKVTDAVDRAEKQSAEGIQFIVPDETPEEKLRRLVAELQEIRDEVPTPLVEKILDENGLMLKTTAAEIKQAMDAVDAVAREQIDRERAEREAQEHAQAAAAAEDRVEPPPPAPSIGPSPADLMRNRQPLNNAPVPTLDRVPQRQAPSTVPATRQPMNAPPLDAVPAHMIQGPPVTGNPSSKAAQWAAIEADADSVGALNSGPADIVRPVNVPTLERKLAPPDAKTVRSVIDQPPKVGLNPHFRPPRRA